MKTKDFFKNLFRKETTSLDSVSLNILEILNYVISIAVVFVGTIIVYENEDDYILIGFIISLIAAFLVFIILKVLNCFFLNVERGLKHLIQLERKLTDNNEKNDQK